ncbi:diguanylate cyclase domain-containing protein [Pseudoalteromonas sp. SSM20]|uniref:diguanylate cyclase domain-containing protein n=1 Tax=Pseudoalteromonas sp. SSM20 TaxID=3139394 RepID=UPI003BAC9C39
MNIQKIRQVGIFTESPEVTAWLECTLKLTSIAFDSVCIINKTSDIASSSPSLLIVTERKFRTTYNYLRKVNKLLPVLVVTSDFNGFSVPNSCKLTIDILPLPAATIGLVEHSIKAVFQDFKLNQELTKLAHYDALTGAANRLLFQDRCKQALKMAKRSKRAVSLLYFDLDDFKPINDTYGHDVGDELLRRFVQIISSVSRETDTLARLGGDEFALLLPDTPESELSQFCQKIIQHLREPQQLNEHEIEIKCSIGAVSTSREEHVTLIPQKLIKKADQAVYRAKEVEGSSFVII